MRLRTVSALTLVASGGKGSSSSMAASSASPSASRATDSNRCATFDTAPRPLRARIPTPAAPAEGDFRPDAIAAASGEVSRQRGLHLGGEFVDARRIAGMVDSGRHRRTSLERRDHLRRQLEAQKVDRRSLLVVLTLEVLVRD